MNALNVVAALTVFTALFSFINHRYFRLPSTIGLTVLSLFAVLVFSVLDLFGFGMIATAAEAMSAVNFSDIVLKIVLGILLFAGALHVNLTALMGQRWTVGVLSTLGVLLSALIVAIGTYGIFWALGFPLSFAMCLLFGALISPTDPIAVLALLKEAKVPESLEMKIAGEALLNDGVAVVLFVSVLGVVTGAVAPSFNFVLLLFLREILGGLLFGFVIGSATYQLIERSRHYHEEILLSLALVVGGYVFAQALHVSGPLAMVMAGLIIGDRRHGATSAEAQRNLDLFWEVVDHILNAAFFVLLGFVLVLLHPRPLYFVAGVLGIALVLAARFASVWLSVKAIELMHRQKLSEHAATILTWGGLRGGICLALALALPPGESRDALLVVAYFVVIFSLLVQGLTMKPLLRRLGV